jgi:hypothetical protein
MTQPMPSDRKFGERYPEVLEAVHGAIRERQLDAATTP